jgi:CheY-like chemotaxis protein
MKILLIENNLSEAKKYEQALLSFGFQMYHAKGAIEAIKKLNEEKFSLILLNIILHDMHGLNLIKTLQKNNPDFNIPIVILTNSDDDIIIEEAYKLNVSGYLIKKNYAPEQIADFIKNSLYINK